MAKFPQSQVLNIQPKGKVSNPNQLSEAPPGAMVFANNVVIDRESLVEARRGLGQYGDEFNMTAWLTSTVVRTGTGNGTLQAQVNRKNAVAQTWTVTMTTPTTFSVSGSVSGAQAAGTTDTVYDVADLITLTVNVGSTPFIAGDFFTFSCSEETDLRDPLSMFQYQDTIFIQGSDTSSSVTGTGVIYYDSDGLGDFQSVQTRQNGLVTAFDVPAAGYRVRGVEATGVLYIVTDQSIQKLDGLEEGVFQRSGQGLLPWNIQVVTGGSGSLPDNYAVAYRWVVFYDDGVGNRVTGPVSDRWLLTNNTGGSVDATVTILADPGIGSLGSMSSTRPSGMVNDRADKFKYQVYRSRQVDTTTGAEPDDEMFLVKEGYLTDGTAYNGSWLITFTDEVNDDNLGGILYTNPTQEGILQSNNRAPFAHDLAVFKEHLFLANTKTVFQQTIQLLAVASYATATVTFSGQPNPAETITVNGVVFTAVAGAPAANQFQIGGSASATATNLFTAINASVSVGVAGVITATDNGSGVITLTADAVGSGGNAYTLAEGLTNVAISGATFAGGADGLQVGDTVTITTVNGGAITYTGAAAENINSLQFLVSTAGDAGTNVILTAQSLARVISRRSQQQNPVHSFFASYIDDPSSLPGKISLIERFAGDANTGPGRTTGGWYCNSSRPDVWTPELPTSGDKESARRDERANRVAFSKQQQPEAFPPTNYLDVGIASEPILRIIASRDSIFVMKTDGIFRIIGDSAANFAVQPLDQTTELVAPHTATLLNNQVWAFCDQGIVAITDTGVQVMSRAIEYELLQRAAQSSFAPSAWGMSYESERKYIFFAPESDNNEYPDTIYTYNLFTDAWTNWNLGVVKGGVVRGDDNKLYMINADEDVQVRQERKTYTLFDFADFSYDINVVSQTLAVLTLTDATNVREGDAIKQGSLYNGVLSVDGNDVTLINDDVQFAAGAAEVYQSFPIDFEFVPQHAQNPGLVKNFRELTLLFRDPTFTSLDLLTGTDFGAGTYSEVELIPLPTGTSWGAFPWGTIEWGGAISDQQGIRTLLARNAKRGLWLKVRLQLNAAFTTFGLLGYSLTYNPVSERFGFPAAR